MTERFICGDGAGEIREIQYAYVPGDEGKVRCRNGDSGRVSRASRTVI